MKLKKLFSLILAGVLALGVTGWADTKAVSVDDLFVPTYEDAGEIVLRTDLPPNQSDREQMLQYADCGFNAIPLTDDFCSSVEVAPYMEALAKYEEELAKWDGVNPATKPKEPDKPDYVKALELCEELGIDVYIRPHSDFVAEEPESVRYEDPNNPGQHIYAKTYYEERFYNFDFTKYPAVKGFMMVDEPTYGKYYPIDETVIPVDNLIIRMAWWSNVAYSYFDDRQPAIAERIKGWHAVGHKFFFWAYDTDFTTFLWYFPSLHCIKENILGFKDLGVEYLMFESSDGSKMDWQADLKCYIYSKLMWNTSLSVNDLYNEYLGHYFGAAADHVKRCSAIMEHYSSFVESVYDNYWVATFEWTYRHMDLWNAKIFDRVLAILDYAEKAIKDAGVNVDYYLKHLACVKVTFLHMKVNKVNRELFENINLGGVTRFCGTLDIPEYKKQSFYNVEMEYRVVEPVIIPDDVKEKINNLDVYSISDELDLDNVIRQFSRTNGEGIDDENAFVLSDVLDL